MEEEVVNPPKKVKNKEKKSLNYCLNNNLDLDNQEVYDETLKYC